MPIENLYNCDVDSLPVNTFYESVTAMLLKLQHYYPTAKLLYILPYYYTDCETCNSTPYTLKKFNDAAIEVCDCLGVDYVDLRKIINNSNIDTHLSEDNFPNSTGMNAIAKCVINKLKSLDLNN